MQPVFADGSVRLALDYHCAVAWPELPDDAEARLGTVIHATIARAGLRGSFVVSLRITGDRQMQRVNQRYRGIDKATDVLSFPQSAAPLLPLPPDVAWVARPFGDDTHAAPPPDPLPIGDGEGVITDGGSWGSTRRLPNVPIGDGEGEITDGGSWGSTRRLPNVPIGDGEGEITDGADRVGQTDMLSKVPALSFAGEQPYHLGDIMISVPTVARQAADASHSAWWEVCFLVAHGTLHLLGYDDYYEPGYQAMVALQDAVLADLAIPRAGK
jgi:rRNA maturation RNase YbeY